MLCDGAGHGGGDVRLQRGPGRGPGWSPPRGAGRGWWTPAHGEAGRRRRARRCRWPARPACRRRGVEAVVVTLTVTEPGAPVRHGVAVRRGPARRVEPELRRRRHGRPTSPRWRSAPPATSACSRRPPANLIVDLSAWYGAGDNRAASVVPTRDRRHPRRPSRSWRPARCSWCRPTAAARRAGDGRARGGPERHRHRGRDGRASSPSTPAINPSRSRRTSTSSPATTPPTPPSSAWPPGTGLGLRVQRRPPTHVVVDINGWFGPLGLARFSAQAPQRLVDTRHERQPVRRQRHADRDAAQRADRRGRR